MNDALHTPVVRAALPFVNGGMAGMVATTIIQPIDMVKVRIQLAGEGGKQGPRPTPAAVARNIVASGKVLDLYTGLSAGLLRQAVYTTARMGFFQTFQNALAASARRRDRDIVFAERVAAAVAAGGLAALIGNPADLALIRMQSDGLKPVAARENYRGVGDALARISRREGVLRLWAGCSPTVTRAMALNAGQLAPYDEAKGRLLAAGFSAKSSALMASMVSGFCASFASLPFDFIKTRLQKQTPLPDGSLPYKSMLDCFLKVYHEEGLFRFYRGLGTYCVRIAPHAAITVMVVDYLRFLTN